MARVDYDEMAGRYDGARRLDLDGLADWRAALVRHLPSRADLTVIDLGSGTGQFCFALAEWFDATVFAVEPSAAMRAEARRKSADPRVVHIGGVAEAIPFQHRSCDVAWLSTVIHHISDLQLCARELKRVLVEDGIVLIRSAFPGRLDDISLFRFFPAARRVIETFPTIEATVATFAAAGFSQRTLESVAQVSAANLAEACERVRLRADTTLKGLSDEEFAAGMAAVEAAAREDRTAAPVVDRLDLLVLQATGTRSPQGSESPTRQSLPGLRRASGNL
jgi:ubiquinone/menaquinone biosynthesis C-methylase UbiE